ncbi:MAG: methylase involved in ubiquinone/menaquinone biosynthesis [Planctomycetota bacterium]|nr:methylase involved in ubiquinone/menaquinone biosynthesis [Planctomycetota bacterium]
MDAKPVQEAPSELSPKDGYAAWASCYDSDGNPLIALEGPAVMAMAGRVAGFAVLDVGCGTGRHTRALVEAGARVVATDQSPEMMERARRKFAGSEVTWIRHTLPEPFPFDGEQFDLAVMGLVAEHVADLATVLRELIRVVKPRARCLLSALHPDRTAEGQRARFIDPETGIRRPIATIHRTIDEYRSIAESSGWLVREEVSLIVPESLVIPYPRAARYVGLPLGWVVCLERMEAVTS